jgi:hypothetical protein
MAKATFLQLLRVQIPREIIKRQDRVKYLVLPIWRAKELMPEIENTVVRMSEGKSNEFDDFIEVQVNKFLEGEKPPAEIETMIMNFADCKLRGEDIVIRAGDYIALQNYYQNG